jgi:calcium-dependent protein kinase
VQITHTEDYGGEKIINFDETSMTLLDDMNERFKKSSTNAYKETEIGIIMHQIFSLLSFFHNFGYIHRDIKPENFLISTDANYPLTLRLCCLSTMENMHKAEYAKGIVGTYLYMAPEMISGKPYDTQVDMWSAGVIMYMLLTGEHPLIATESSKTRTVGYKERILLALHSENVKTVDEEKIEMKLLPDKVKSLLIQLLELDPKKRITAERALRVPWQVECWNEKRSEFSPVLTNALKPYSAIDVHNILMSIVSAVCAPTLKKLLLDHMCNPAECARDFPAVEPKLLELYKYIFFFSDKNGNGFLSKEELYSCNFPDFKS